jgi:rhodanese-related sulfurtransferase
MSDPSISGATTMADLQQLIPGARRALFAAYHIGGCQSCGFQDDETLAQVCERNDKLPVDAVIAQLEAAAEHDRAIQIDPADLKARLDAGADLKLLDIRSREEFDAVRIDGSEILTTESQQEAFGKWPPETEVVIIDHSGDRSLDAASFFIGHGLKQTKALAGGIDAYAQVADPPLPRYKIELDTGKS